MKITKYILLSTTVFGLVNPLVALADENSSTNESSISQVEVSSLSESKTNDADNVQVQKTKNEISSQEIDYAGVTMSLDSNGVLSIPDGVAPTNTAYLSKTLDKAGALSQVKTIKLMGRINLEKGAGRCDTVTSGLPNVENIEGLENTDFSKIENFSGMFEGDSSLKNVDVNSMDTSSAINMYSMFEGTSSLTSLKISNWDTSNVKRMDAMFQDSGIQTLDMKTLNLSKVENMSYMFSESKLKSFDFTGLSIPSLTTMAYMFNKASNLTNVNIGTGFDADKLKMLSGMFLGTAIKKLDLRALQTQNVTSMGQMFEAMKDLTDINLEGMDTSNVNLMPLMFAFDTSLETLNLSDFDTSKVDELGMGQDGGMNFMFYQMPKLKKVILGSKFIFKKDEVATTGIDNGHEDSNYAWYNKVIMDLSLVTIFGHLVI